MSISKPYIYIIRCSERPLRPLLLLLLALTAATVARAQTAADSTLGARAASLADTLVVASDSIVEAVDSMYAALLTDSTLAATADSALTTVPSVVIDQRLKHVGKKKRDWTNWRPNPQRALWLALVIPGGGQIYNRKYWKLPIVYGGFVGCIYAMMWNNMMYSDYSQAYLDIMDDDPNTASYNKFLHLGRTIDKSNEDRYKQIFKSRKDKYRRWRDLSFFTMLGVYAISVIDAYVDAELSDFDISKDLSLKVRPTIMGNGATALTNNTNPLRSTSLGVNCSLNF